MTPFIVPTNQSLVPKSVVSVMTLTRRRVARIPGRGNGEPCSADGRQGFIKLAAGWVFVHLVFAMSDTEAFSEL
jgi:hypothetical protein